MKKILIDGYNPTYSLVAVESSGVLLDIFCENNTVVDLVGNIYLGRISNVMEAISAYFVDFGRDKNGFLPFSSCNRSYTKDEMVLVQVRKNERGDKGARLSSFVKLVGRYHVYMPNGDKNIPGPITNTKPKKKSYTYAKEDLAVLQKLWHRISSVKSQKPVLLHQELSLIGRMLRDRYFDEEVEIIVEGKESFNRINRFVQELSMDVKVEHYISNVPLLAEYAVFEKVKQTISNVVRMKSGASIVIDSSEAMTSIDVNSSSHRGEKSIEETSYRVNLEVAVEIARQIRLRDIGGIIAVDFIDMHDQEHIAEVERVFRAEMESTNEHQLRILGMNEFCVLMLSRQRINQDLRHFFYSQCSVTKGFLRTKESMAFEIMLEIRLSILTSKNTRVTVECPAPVADYLLNEGRALLYHLESHTRRTIVIRSNPGLISEFRIDPKHSYLYQQKSPKPQPAEERIVERIVEKALEIKEFEVPIGFFRKGCIPIYMQNEVTLVDIG